MLFLSDSLHASILHQLHQTTRLLSRQINTLLEPFGLYAAEWPILLLLHKGPLTQVELSEQLHIEPPAVSKTLRNLEKKGVLTRVTGVDRRQKQSVLTAHGLQLYQACLQQIEPERQKFIDFLSREECRQLMHLLDKVQANVVPKSPPVIKEPL